MLDNNIETIFKNDSVWAKFAYTASDGKRV